MNKKWYVVYTKPQSEKKVAAILSRKNIESYCPLNRTSTIKGSKKRILTEPLFPSYVFVHISEADMNIVTQVNSVVNFLYWLQSPVVIKDDEIAKMKHFAEQYTNILIEKTNVNSTATVKFITEQQNDFNTNGILLSVIKSSLRLLLPCLGYIMIAQMESTVDIFNVGFERVKMVS